MNRKPKNILGRLIGCVVDLLLLLVTITILIGIYYVFQIKVENKSYADMFGYTFFEVATGSMNPTIDIGDIVVVKLTKDITPNEIIVYQEGENIITHRYIEKKGNKIIAKGDANNTEDKQIVIDDVLGKVIQIIPKVGIWRKIILSPEVISLILILLAVFSLMFIFNLKTEDKNE